jgi:hypothetical protein
MPVLWALGWIVTTLIGYEVDKQVMVFGASGALVFTALSGAVLHLLLPAPRGVEEKPADTPVGARG